MIRGFLLIGSAALLSAACSIYDSSLTARGPKGAGGKNGGSGDDPGGGAGQESGGGSQAGGAGNGGSGGGSAGATCNHKTYPPLPVGKNLGGDIEIVAIQSDVDLGDSAPSTVEAPTRFRGIGFDLDDICTTTQNATQMVKCTLPSSSRGVPDGPDGQDNAMGQVIQITRNLLTNFSSEIYSAQLRKGAANSIIHVTGYNGKADDDQVQVEVLVSARFNAFDPKALPKWDGTDVWPVAEDSVNDRSVTKPKNVDPRAYVSGGKLMGSLGDTGLRLLIGFTDTYTVNLTLFLHAAFTVCDIVPTDAGHWGYTLQNCTLAGRWTADDLIQQLWHFPDPLDLKNPKPLCTNSTSYPAFKSTICDLRDITSGTATPTTPCDALSMGVNFNTIPARIGDVFANDLFAPPCPATADPSNDSCDSEAGVLPPIGTGGTAGSGGASSSGGKAGQSSMDASTDGSQN